MLVHRVFKEWPVQQDLRDQPVQMVLMVPMVPMVPRDHKVYRAL
jgi:hypothetical protein